jgi:filamentous hemagglutinin family protein
MNTLTKKWQKSLLKIVSGLGLSLMAIATPLSAQVIPDGTLGTTVNTSGTTYNITGGTLAGQNLFHSFTTFSVPTGNTAYFNNAVNIQNIINRVTGNSVSNIQGTIQANGTANLFLINPNGIIFGYYSSLNIGGSFVATTANGLRFGNVGTFGLNTTKEQTALLTVNPSAFFYNQMANQGTNSIEHGGLLQVSAGKSILLVGGNPFPNSNSTGTVVIDGGYILTEEGNIEIGGLNTNGEIGLNIEQNHLSLNVPENLTRNDIDIKNYAWLKVSGDNGGNITINGRNITIENGAELDVFSSTQGKDANIKINASDTATFNNSFASTLNGGNITINGRNIIIENGAALEAFPPTQGNAGNIEINANDTVTFNNGFAVNYGGNITLNSHNITLENASELDAVTLAQGNAGNIKINANDTVTFNNSLAGNMSYPGVVNGNIFVNTGNLNLINNAKLISSTLGQENAGNIQINANDTIKLDHSFITSSVGANTVKNAGNISITANNTIKLDQSFITSSIGANAVGNSGNITINTKSLDLQNNSYLSAGVDTFGQGNAGNIQINANDTIKFNQSSLLSIIKANAVGNAGNVTINTNFLDLDKSYLTVDNSGKGNAGNVQITANNTIKFDNSYINSYVYENVGNSGNITINTKSLDLQNDSYVTTSIRGQGTAGNITINANNTVKLNNSKITSSMIQSTGNGGNITVNTNSLDLANHSYFSVTTFGQGNAGNIQITANNSMNFDQGSHVSSDVGQNAIGNGGNITFNTSALNLNNKSSISSSVLGQGNGGNITINSGQISLDQLSYIQSPVGSEQINTAVGNAGNIILNGQDLSLSNNSSISSGSSGQKQGNGGNIIITANNSVLLQQKSYIRASAYSKSANSPLVGNAGDISITTGELKFQSNSSILSTTSAIGNAGNINLNANNIILDSSGISSDVSTLIAQGIGNAGNITINSHNIALNNGSYISSGSSGKGNAGNININTDVLSLYQSRGLSTTTNKEGNAGDININANDTVTFNQSYVLSEIGDTAIGNGGNININTPSLFLNNGGWLTVSTFGKGNAGNINIKSDHVNIIGNKTSFLSYTRSDHGIAGTITVNSKELVINDKAKLIADTNSIKDGGNININSENFLLSGGSQLVTKTTGSGSAGNITIKVDKNFTLTGNGTGLFANTEEGSTGNGGNIFIDPDVVNMNNSAIAVNSQGTGTGGDITLIANKLILSNNSSITAETASNKGGDINLQIPQYLMFLDSSKITSTAGTSQLGGDGGNIKITTPFIFAFPTNPNHQIIANAYTGKGGNIDITTNGIFSDQFIDIKASSQFGINGNVNINTPGIDPANGLVTLPSVPVDPSQLVSRDFCKKISQDSSFVVKGKGGLPTSANDLLTADMTWDDWRSLSENIGKVSHSNSQTSLLIENPRDQNKIITGQGWFKNNQGSIIITSEPRKFLAYAGNFSPLDCEQFRRLNVK